MSQNLDFPTLVVLLSNPTSQVKRIIVSLRLTATLDCCSKTAYKENRSSMSHLNNGNTSLSLGIQKDLLIRSTRYTVHPWLWSGVGKDMKFGTECYLSFTVSARPTLVSRDWEYRKHHQYKGSFSRYFSSCCSKISGKSRLGERGLFFGLSSRACPSFQGSHGDWGDWPTLSLPRK